MKRTATMVEKETTESRELELFAMNNSDIIKELEWYRDNTLGRKYHKGTYDREKAKELTYQVATESAKLYCKIFGGCYYQTFDVTARWTVASYMEAYIYEGLTHQ